MNEEPADSLRHPVLVLNEVIHQRTRLGILTILAESGRSDFSYLRTKLELTDGNLGRHLDVLADAGFVRVDKVIEGRRPRTWLSITRFGRQALFAQIAAMRELVDRVERAGTDTTTQGEGPTDSEQPRYE